MTSKELKKQKIKNKEELTLMQSLAILFKYIAFYKTKFIIVIVLSVLFALINVGAIVGIYFVFKVIGESLKLPGSSVDFALVSLYLGILLIAYLISLVFSTIQTVFMVKIAQQVGNAIRSDLFKRIQVLKLSYFDQNSSGDIMSRLTNDTNNVTVALSQNFTQFITITLQISSMLIAMFVFSPYIALVVFGLSPLMLGAVFIAVKKSQPYFNENQQRVGELNGFAEEMISAHRVTNTFNKKSYLQASFDTLNNKIIKANATSQIISGLTGPWNLFMASFLQILAYALAIIFALNNIEFGGAVSTLNPNGATNPGETISLIGIFILFLNNFTNPIFQLFQLLNIIQGAISGTKRFHEVLVKPSEHLEEENIIVKNIKGKIEVKNLNFSYDGKTPVLKNINFIANPGETIAIVGPTGSGKTTFINLLTKFYNVEDGDILIDNQSIKQITKSSLRENVSVVLQDTFLFEDTVANNIKLSKPNATMEEIINSAKVANADHFIRSLEHGYDTMLKPEAEDLSLGQKQLLAIARAVLRDANILILDEATSSIDTKTEKDIQDAMLKLMENKTSFVIAHRLSTIKNADQILVLRNGEIIEHGNHLKLLEDKGFYYKMYTSARSMEEFE
ncbi:ABC transporter ATP-binding protein [[Mycoplasma] mobile]|nr:ABC transporter ATP-binding protein [[Mycoplasma] mobile]